VLPSLVYLQYSCLMSTPAFTGHETPESCDKVLSCPLKVQIGETPLRLNAEDFSTAHRTFGGVGGDLPRIIACVRVQ